jgi:hypothetical protein
MRRGLAAWLVVSLAVVPLLPRAQPHTSAAGCAKALGEPGRQVVRDDLAIAWRPVPHSLPLDRHFAIEIQVCGRPVDGLRIDAVMPAHRHGMNYRATVENRGAGRYMARGLLFHMAGRWQLIFDIDVGGQRLRLTDDIDLR